MRFKRRRVHVRSDGGGGGVSLRPTLAPDFAREDVARYTHELFGVKPLDERALLTSEPIATSALWRRLLVWRGIAGVAEWSRVFTRDTSPPPVPYALADYERQLTRWMHGAESYAAKLSASSSAMRDLWWCFEFYALDDDATHERRACVFVRNGLATLVRCLYCVYARALVDADYAAAAAEARRLCALVCDSTARCVRTLLETK